uniref:Uncharacterized protein n=1 Tax=Panagrolaimus davidi TaxID=227884 RepID=A0A914PKH9_9BILA
MFIYQEALILIKYFSYPVNVDTALSFGERVYPAVTICNINAYKLSLAKNNPALGKLIDAYKKETPDADFGFDTTTFEKQLRATRWMNLMFSELEEYDNKDKTNKIAYTYDDLVITCTYNTEACNETEWIASNDPYYGRCFTYNSDGGKKSSRAGPLYGLSLVLRVDQAEYLPWAQSAGITFLVHEPTDHPFVYTSGYYAAAGSASSVGIRYISKKKLSAPYSDCTDHGSKQKIYYETNRYQTEACVRSCLQDKFTSTCGCFDPTYEYVNGSAEFGSCYKGTKDETSKNSKGKIAE